MSQTMCETLQFMTRKGFVAGWTKKEDTIKGEYYSTQPTNHEYVMLGKELARLYTLQMHT